MTTQFVNNYPLLGVANDQILVKFHGSYSLNKFFVELFWSTDFTLAAKNTVLTVS